MLKTLNIAFFSILVLCLIACNMEGNNERTIDHDAIAQEAIEDYENYRLKINLDDSNILEFPSPVELATSYKNSGIDFIPGVTNPPYNYENYYTQTKKALNFGVYSADLSYCILNEQGQCASDYFIALQNLSEKIGLAEIFKYEVVLSSINENLGSKDSMSQLVKGIQKDLDATLHRDGTQDKAILFYTGAWIESAYIASNAPANFTNSVDTATLNRLSDQMEMLSDIAAEIDEIKDKSNEVLELQQMIRSFQISINSVRITANQDSVVIHPADLKKLKDEIGNLRNYVVS